MTPLIDSEQLASRLGEAGLVVIDIRSGPDAEAAFAAGHVPGSLHADYAAAGWRVAKGGAPGWLPDEEALADLLGRYGIRRESGVVIVSAGDFSTAARVYWTLKAAGHERVSVLDGGFAAWSGEGRPVETGPSARPASSAPYPVRLDESLRASREDVEAAVEDRSAVLLDARGRSDFLGDTKSPHAPRPGRLPGALHADQAAATDPETRRLREPDALRELFGAVPEGPVVTYCNTGQAAATDWFILSEILGRPDVRLYDGSMSDWTQDPSRPVETGERKHS